MKYKRILCPIDFSDASYDALRTAADIAADYSAKLIVVHVVQPVTPLPNAEMPRSFDVRAYEDQLRTGMESKLSDVVRTMIPKIVQAQARTMCCGNPAETIVELADKEDVDLIVIATHGMAGWRHYVHGSVAQKVVQHTKRNVLLVHGEADRKSAHSEEKEHALASEDPGTLSIGVIP